jgi:predicted ABC-type transport system involved in lysophospholipase L1 biosynthesis ATPase subunit
MTFQVKKFEDEKKDEIRRKNISIIFQDNNLLNDFTAIENVMMPLIIKGENLDNSKNKAQKILKAVKILDRSQHFPKRTFWRRATKSSYCQSFNSRNKFDFSR